MRQARIELAISAWQADGLPLHHRRVYVSKLSKIKNAEAFQEHRAGIEPASPRYDGGILPLDHQCLSLVSCLSSVGPVGIEPTSFGLKDRCITLSATIPLVSQIGVEGIEPSTVVL